MEWHRSPNSTEAMVVENEKKEFVRGYVYDADNGAALNVALRNFAGLCLQPPRSDTSGNVRRLVNRSACATSKTLRGVQWDPASRPCRESGGQPPAKGDTFDDLMPAVNAAT
jgi:hypothetical protein